ncbi:hypothetical protein LVD17_23700 [Fulvivirga ulvae]|uniref:hypothetical protein n=1 Tax=Fulvivirga ulvae TaxID=2904245 RepID=UPI001F1E2F70|nr:hypothetical protein [Fulvivirga ulvae]UII31301.1 hypothetical protein LVD17_23700 [Fulvivirga ulvae]
MSNKVCYHSKGEAEEALIHLQAKYRSASGGGPISAYWCPHCGYYHTSSKGDKSSTLQSSETQKRIEIQQEANYWEEKFKGKH